MTRSVSDLRSEVLAEFPQWLPKYAEMVLPRNQRKLKDWVGGDDTSKFSISMYMARFSLYHLKRFVLDALNGNMRMEELALAGRLAFPQLPYAVGVQHLNTNSGILMEEFVQSLTLVATMGWKDETELLARLGLQELMKYGIMRGNHRGGGLGQGTTSHGYTYMVMDLVRDWLKADKTSTVTAWREELYESYAGGYGGWADLLANWREPNLATFTRILLEAADYHVAESKDMETIGHKHDEDFREIHHEIQDDEFWLLPVLLFMVLRLRQWEGLPIPPYLSHPLFEAGVFRQLPPVPQWPSDPFYDQVDARFRQVFPSTPSVADLPALRKEQGGA